MCIAYIILGVCFIRSRRSDLERIPHYIIIIHLYSVSATLIIKIVPIDSAGRIEPFYLLVENIRDTRSFISGFRVCGE